MTQSAALVWQVQNGGADANGGGGRFGCELATPPAPTVANATTGGSVAAATYYVVTTLTTGNGETGKSPETSTTTTGTTSTITVTSPTNPNVTGATWNVYVSTTSGGPYWSQSSGNAFGSNKVITATPPASGNQAPGTDYSQQPAPQVVINNSTIICTTPAANSNTLTFTAGYTPTAADVGNVVHLTAGTNIRAGWYEITAYTSTTWTLTGNGNATTATAGGSAVTGNMGGALATPGGFGAAFASDGVANQTCFIKYNATAYSIGTTANAAAGRINTGTACFISGYDTTRTKTNQDANKPALDCATPTSTPVLASTGGNAVTRQLKVTNVGANTGITGFSTGGRVEFLTSVGVATGLLHNFGSGSVIADCFMVNCTTGYNINSGSGNTVERCAHVSNVTNNVGFTTSNNTVYVGCEAYSTVGGTGSGFGPQASVYVNCTARGFSGAGANGFYGNSSNPLQCVNCVAWNNTNDYAQQGTQVLARLFNCAGQTFTGINATQARGLVTLTADPHTAPASNDFSLNSAVGGGALCKAAGIQIKNPAA